MKNLVHDRTVVYNVGYHIVLSVKYNRNVLCCEIAQGLEQVLHEMFIDNGFVMRSMEIMPDHLHVFISAKPRYSAYVEIIWHIK